MKTKLLHGLAALATFGLAACSSEDVIPDGPGDDRPQENRTVYVNIAISGDMTGAGTRAGLTDGNPDESKTTPEGENAGYPDFENGSDQESKVDNAYFVFYDKGGNMLGNIVNVKLGKPEKVTTPSGTVEERFFDIVQIDDVPATKTIKQVLCFINPESPNDLQKRLSEIQTVTRNNVYTGSGENQLFAMSNSVYYDKDDKLIVATEIPEGAIFNSREEAQKEKNNEEKIVDIYVERYAAKIKFNSVQPNTYKTKAMKANGEMVDIELDFQIQGWVLNGESTSTYAVKSFRGVSEDPKKPLPDNYTYTELNGILNTINESASSWVWNNPDYHRSFWAVSPAYFVDKYPEVELDIKDKVSPNQKYYKYVEIVGGTDKDGTKYETYMNGFRQRE